MGLIILVSYIYNRISRHRFMREHISVAQEPKNTRDNLDEETEPPQLYHPERQFKQNKMVYVILAMSFVILIAAVYTYDKQYRPTKSIIPSHVSHEIYIAQQLPHDQTCYTQGLSYINRTHLLQSCGIYGQSYFHILEYDNKQIKEVYRSPVFRNNLFIEGSVFFPKNGLYYFLTWRENTVLRYFEKEGRLVEKDRLMWDHPGWGLTHNQTHLILSQGTNKLYVADENLKVVRTIEVLDSDKLQMGYINELEYVEEDGMPYVYANIYLTATIVKIDFNSGIIVEEYNMQNIVDRQPQAIQYDEVINGIAYSQSTKEYLLTGKRWKRLYRIQAF